MCYDCNKEYKYEGISSFRLEINLYTYQLDPPQNEADITLQKKTHFQRTCRREQASKD